MRAKLPKSGKLEKSKNNYNFVKIVSIRLRRWYITGCGEYKFSIRMNIRIYLYPKNDTNEYPNIFVSKR